MKQSFKAYLESIGDSIVCVADDDIVENSCTHERSGTCDSESAHIRSAFTE